MNKRREAWDAWQEAEAFLEVCKNLLQNAETCNPNNLPAFEDSLEIAFSKITWAAALTREAAAGGATDEL